MSPSIRHCVEQMSAKRSNKLAKSKEKKAKEERVVVRKKKLVLKTAIAKVELQRREGGCCRGIGMEDQCTVDELVTLRQAGVLKEKRATTATTNRKAKKCTHCQRSGHATPRSKKCGKHEEWLAGQKQKRTAAAAAGAGNDGLAAANMVADDVTLTPKNSSLMDEDDDSPANEETNLDADLCDVHDGMPLEDGHDDDGNDEEFYDTHMTVEDISNYDKENRVI